MDPRIAIIIPVCNEEACLPQVLEELLAEICDLNCIVAAGVNASSDRTAEIARRYPVVVAETAERGYGYGCVKAIEAVNAADPSVAAYLFFAGDGASDPREISRLATAYRWGAQMVLGTRTLTRSNWATMTWPHVLANFALGSWCGLLTGRWFSDLAPLRLIDRRLFETLTLQEMTFGWTIEAQIGAAMLGAETRELPVRERKRLGGVQKVSGVTWRQTFSIGCRIFAAGWRAHTRFLRKVKEQERSRAIDLLPQSQTEA